MLLFEMANDPRERLFVPLSTEPFVWFKEGRKKWELRKYGRQYTEKHVHPGRPVELRCGYGARNNALWGTIVAVKKTRGLKEFFSLVPFASVIPKARTQPEAERIVREILRLSSDDSETLIGFEVELYRDRDFT